MSTEQDKNNNNLQDNFSQQETEDNLFKFDPPLYTQRYQYISKLLKKYKSKTYLDIGCAECNLIRHVKGFNNEVNLLIGIDLDEDLLEYSKFVLQPLSLAYIKKRDSPLELYLISGDISCPPDSLINQLNNFSLDFVSLVEVIEHMYSDCLEKTVDVVFGRLKPKIVAITTPNGEYNVVFDRSDKNHSPTTKKFRNYDHKFEWTRKEFEKWCLDILDKYKDTYETCIFDGLGDAPVKFEHVGKCSQIAVFIMKGYEDLNNNFETASDSSVLKSYLNQLLTTQYPHDIDPVITSKMLAGTSYKLVDMIQYPYELQLDIDTDGDDDRIGNILYYENVFGRKIL